MTPLAGKWFPRRLLLVVVRTMVSCVPALMPNVRLLRRLQIICACFGATGIGTTDFLVAIGRNNVLLAAAAWLRSSSRVGLDGSAN